jgi:hypothetical protein
VVGATNLISVAAGTSLQPILSAAKPGDIIELAGGTYLENDYPAIEVSGTAQNWIVVRGAAGSRPTIDLGNGGEFHIGGSYILFENIEIVNGYNNNLHITPAHASTGQTCVILQDVLSHNMASGVGAALKVAGTWEAGAFQPLDGLYVQSSEFAGSLSNAVIDAVAIRHGVVRDCYLHDPVNGSLTCPGVFFKGGSSNILLERNLVRGIVGNSVIMVGGNTGIKYWDPLYANPLIEGVNEVVRNNVMADFTDSAFDIRGCDGAQIYNNTIVTQTTFCIFRLTWGGQDSSSQVGNEDITVANNLVLSYGKPTYSQNDGNQDVTATFGPQLWGGAFKPGYGGGVPAFPLAKDVVVAATSAFGTVLVNPSYLGMTGLADALSRFVLAPGSPAKGAGEANTVAPEDILGVERPAAAPSLGAFE